MQKKYWIPRKLKKGALSRQLGIPIELNIPFQTLLDIKQAPIGTIIRNKYNIGKPYFKVTKLLKKRAVMAYTLKTLRHSNL